MNVLHEAAQRLVDSCIDLRDQQENSFEHVSGVYDQLSIFIKDYVPNEFNELDGSRVTKSFTYFC